MTTEPLRSAEMTTRLAERRSALASVAEPIRVEPPPRPGTDRGA